MVLKKRAAFVTKKMRNSFIHTMYHSVSYIATSKQCPFLKKDLAKCYKYFQAYGPIVRKENEKFTQLYCEIF